MGALITLVGVSLTNRYHAKQHAAQLTHEATENERSRLFALRNNLYLDASGEIVLTQQHLMSLSDLDIASENASSNLDSFFVALNKAALAASNETAIALTAYLDAFGKAFYRLMKLIPPIQDFRTERDIQGELYDKYSAEVARLLAAVRHFNETGQTDPTIWRSLNTSFDHAQENAKNAADARSTAWSQLNALTLEYKRKALVEVADLDNLILDAMVSIRSELGISTDVKLHKAMMEQRIAVEKKAFQEFTTEIQDDA